MANLSTLIRAGMATKLVVLDRAGSSIQVSLANGFLQVVNRATSTVNVPVN